jgi:hypothetical protein
MIVFDLSCEGGHRFEGWFASSDDFAAQQVRGLVGCPQCGSREVVKAPMAPAVPVKGNRQRAAAPSDDRPVLANAPMSLEVAEALQKLAEAQARALENSTWVGDSFAEQSRAMHYGEREHETIHGRASADEARALFEEGVPVAPLPFPVAPPEELN